MLLPGPGCTGSLPVQLFLRMPQSVAHRTAIPPKVQSSRLLKQESPNSRGTLAGGAWRCQDAPRGAGVGSPKTSETSSVFPLDL